MNEILNENENKLLSTRSEKNKDLKKNFYDFRNIYKIEDFYCFSENNSYITLQTNNHKSINSTTFNSYQIVSSFKKSLSSYLIIKKHYESNSNKYFNLISKLKSYKEKKQKSDSLHNILINEISLENVIENSQENQEFKDSIEKPQIKMPFDIQSFNNLKKINEINLVNFEFIIDSEGVQKKVNRKIDLNQLESKFLKKHEHFLNSSAHPKEEIIERLSQNFEGLLQKMKFTPFLIKMPKHLKPTLQDFNDFYTYQEKDSDSEKKEKIEKQNSEKQVEKQLTKEEIDDIVIDQMLDNNNNEIIENLEKKEDEDEEESEISDEHDEEDGKIVINSQKVLKKMQKYLNKNQNIESSKAQKPNNQKLNRPKKIKKKYERNEGNEIQDLQQNDINIEKNLNKSETIININEEKKKNRNNEDDFLESEKLIIQKTNDDKALNEEEKEIIPNLNVKKSKMDIIDRLLNSKDIFSEDLSDIRPQNIKYPEIPNDLKFNDENEKQIFHKIFYWLYEVELQVEKDKIEIESYERDYQNKFFEILKNDPIQNNNKEVNSSAGSEEDEDEEDEDDEESDT